MKRCLYCYLSLNEDEQDFHPSCARKFFGHNIAPILPYDENKLEELGTKLIQSQQTITGVQPKLSLGVSSDGNKDEIKKLTIVGLWGDYILKPPSKHYQHLPETEDITMHLATIAKINVVPHSLIRMESGNLAYITKRIDRSKKTKIHMEDMCQLTERLTEDKYHGSYEQIAKTIRKYSSNPVLDVINFFEIVLFSFITGNADMHLKNFSLIYQAGLGPTLSPAYDLLATQLVNPADDEDLALTLNGKKKKIKKSDFTTAFNTLQLEIKQQENIFKKMEKAKNKWLSFIEISFLNDDFKSSYKELIEMKFKSIK